MNGRPILLWNPQGLAAPSGQQIVRYILMVGTPTLWFAFAPAMLWLVWRIVARRDPAAITVAVGIAAGWLTWFINLERTMFIFYMAPVLPFFVLAVTLALQDVHRPPARRPMAPAARPGPGLPLPRPGGGDVRVLLPDPGRRAAAALGVAAADVVPVMVLSGLVPPAEGVAVAFACVVSFMGIGLVDPILPALAEQLHATPSQVSLLFTSYLVVTAVAMLVTGWVSSRIGAKRTLIVGLALIVVFAALAGALGQRSAASSASGPAGAWATPCSSPPRWRSSSPRRAAASPARSSSTRPRSASASPLGPLLGGLLGNVSWRGPFFGVAVLMAIALIATRRPAATPTPGRPARSACATRSGRCATAGC